LLYRDRHDSLFDVRLHLRFAMRYEPIDLNVLDALFQKIERAAFEAWIKTEPVGKYARRAWYLYELLTGQVLDIQDVPPTENVMLLDPKLHVTATGRRVRRQRIIDNLLGNKNYCPMTVPTISVALLRPKVCGSFERNGPRLRNFRLNIGIFGLSVQHIQPKLHSVRCQIGLIGDRFWMLKSRIYHLQDCSLLGISPLDG
jgi:hypothetical protein